MITPTETPYTRDYVGHLLFAHLNPEGLLPMLNFVRAAEHGQTPNPDTMRYVMLAFKSILGGEKPKKALLLERKGKRPSSRIAVRDLNLALWVEALRGNGMTEDAAQAAIADVKGVNQHTVEAAHERFRKVLQAVPELIEEVRVQHEDVLLAIQQGSNGARLTPWTRSLP
jgi:hypothetical protein